MKYPTSHLTMCSCWPSPLPSPLLPFLTVTLVQCSRLVWCTIFPLFHGWQCTVKDSLLITEQLICKPPSAVKTLTDCLPNTCPPPARRKDRQQVREEPLSGVHLPCSLSTRTCHKYRAVRLVQQSAPNITPLAGRYGIVIYHKTQSVVHSNCKKWSLHPHHTITEVLIMLLSNSYITPTTPLPLPLPFLHSTNWHICS